MFHLYLIGVEKTWLSRHFIKKKKNILIGVPPGVSLFTPLPGWMLRQEQWRLTWLAVPPLYFPLPSSRSSGASRRTCCPFPSSIVSVSSLRGTRALAARARPGVCLSLEKHGGKHAPRAPEKKRDPQVALLAGIRLRSMRASLAPLPEPRVDASSSVSARAFAHVSSIVEAFFGKATKNLCEKNGKGVNNTVLLYQFLGCCYKKRFDIIDLFKRSIDVIFLYFSNFDHFLKRDCEIAV